MMNVFVVCGKVVELPVLKKTANGTNYATMVLDLVRPYLNSNSTYDHDRIAVTLWKGIAETTSDTCKVNDVVAVKGRIQTYCVEKENQTYYNYEFIAEHVAHLNA